MLLGGTIIIHDYSQIEYARDFIQKQTNLRPTIGIVLGMETDLELNFLQNKIVIKDKDIPFCPSYFLKGDHKELIIGQYKNKTIAFLVGRYNYYEGYKLDHITFPIRVLQELGVKDILLTRVGGSINSQHSAGNFMVVTDHINFTGLNSLVGPNDSRLGPSYLDLTDLYNKKLIDIAIDVAYNNSITLYDGILAWFTGPAFETPTEIRLLKQFDMDAVASALVPEAIVAYQSGMNVLSLVLLTNKAAGLSTEMLEKVKIIQVANNQKDNLMTLIKGIATRL